MNTLIYSRRTFVRSTAIGVAALWTPGVFAQSLTQTPPQTEGPFYPNKMPLDTDNDLLVVNDMLTPAVGEITYISGRILDQHGNPVRGALVEIWQVDNKAAYIHTADKNNANRDTNFQGFGRFMTGSTGEYLFRTIKPVPYPGRTPHIHYAVKIKGQKKLITQCYIKGHSGNAKDGVLKGIKDPKALESVMVDFAPMKNAKHGELAAKFDIVLGFTPEA